MLSIFIIVLIFNSFVLFSQNQDKEPNILVYIYSEDIDSDLKGIISKTISNELGSAGFNVINIENNTPLTTLMETAEWMGAFFIIEGLYSLKEDVVSFDFNCYSVWDRDVLISVSNEKKLSQSTDQYIKDALAEITSVIWDNLYIVEQIIQAAEEEQVIVEEEQTVVTEEVIDPEPEIKTEYIPDQKELSQQALEKNTISAAQKEPPEEIEKVPEEASSWQDPGPFTITAGIAPFLTTGEATEYFTSGIGFSFFGGYRIINSFEFLTSGVAASIDYFVAEGGEVTSENILLSFGPEIRIGMDFDYVVDIFLRFSLSGTVFMMNTDNTGYRSMLIPSISMGFGVNYYFTENFGVSIVSNYSLFLESSTTISGFIPSVGINYRF